MSSIIVNNVGKAYKQYPNKFSRFLEWTSIPAKKRHTEKWILKDITFTINPGDSVGIIGVNGAGKSTLLKMITGTTAPTTGSIHTEGRVAALLELGMGFHPDFTGRQNAYMAGQLLGFSQEEINGIMPEIESFAAVGDYFDKPVRTYSSGMQARVAFSVATAVKPDILIVDEALSVGDLAFQAKCMQRMNSLLADKVTILFVSHSLAQVRQFCDRAIYIADGKIKSIGDAATVCDFYQNDLVEKKISNNKPKDIEINYAESLANGVQADPNLRANSLLVDTGTKNLEFISFDILNSDGIESNTIYAEDEVVFKAVIRCNDFTPEGAVVGLLIGDKAGFPLLSMNSNYYNKKLSFMSEGMISIITWRFKIPFFMGDYRVDIGIKEDPYSPDFYDRVFCAKVFTVNTPSHLLKNNFGGILYVPADVEVFQK
ncbi:ABC transporter ATP-binding protein [Yersinia mollaretii]|uniref:ABC transporter ATP-binding protein n=1 Tax=Yersinia mollaretii TaxID=33060 RepID=UPI001427D561|nr:ABC transporter ATP-binding protein [Yersinia mollaretii]MDA5534848.1 ABC transporter ATP-binding protein [Yersinia mollaretii]NIL02766.1 ABC transporter ATP-binding protein [Yersinia mollaretii]